MHHWLLAETDAFSAIGRHMHRASSAAGFGYFVMTVCSVAAIWLILQWAERLRLTRNKNAQTVEALFQELCQAHRLSRADRRLLTRAVANLPPQEACGIFIDPRILGRLSLSNSPEVDDYARLSSRLFGDVQGV